MSASECVEKPTVISAMKKQKDIAMIARSRVVREILKHAMAFAYPSSRKEKGIQKAASMGKESKKDDVSM